MELGDGQAKRVDRLELRADPRLFVHLLGVEVVRDGEQPMFCAWLTGVAGGVEPVNVDERRSFRHRAPETISWLHGGDRDVLYLDVALLDLAGQNLRGEVVAVVVLMICEASGWERK